MNRQYAIRTDHNGYPISETRQSARDRALAVLQGRRAFSQNLSREQATALTSDAPEAIGNTTGRFARKRR